MDWDLTSFFPEFRGPEMRAFVDDLTARITAAKVSTDNLPTLKEDTAEQWETALLGLEDIASRRSQLGVYIGCLCAADATNEAYKSEQAAMSKLGADASILESQILIPLTNATAEDLEILTSRPKLKDIAYHIRRLWKKSQKRMSLPEESLAAELAVDGLSAWSRLFGSIAGSLEFNMSFPGGKKESLPISQCRALMTHEDREVREAAFRGGSAAWSSVAEPLRGAINAISGTRHTLNKRRGIPHFLDVALDDAHTTHQTLDAMFSAIENQSEQTRALLKFKCDRMGLPAIAWYDLEASLPMPDAENVDWPTAVDWVSKAFHRRYPALGEFFDEIIEARWIDWSPRPGKAPGGFCSSSRFNGESRIFMTHNDCAHDMMTLAHEVGHAWHSRVLKDHRPFAQGYPMTLAESASTFAELILIEGVADDPEISTGIKLQLAAQELNHSASFLLDIPVRFKFEKAMYEARQNGELSISELNDLMSKTQREVFGDTLIEGQENPLFWAEKGHFYIAGVSFYNFPYTYGYLMSRAMVGKLVSEGDSYLENFEAFLRMSGSADCEEVAETTLEADLGDPAYWASSIESFSATLERTKALLSQVD